VAAAPRHSRTRGRSGRVTVRTILALFALFNAAALHYSTIQPDALLNGLTLGYVAVVGYAMLGMRFRPGTAVAGLASVIVFAWYLQDPPSNNRDWAPEYAIPATVSVSGGTVTFDNIRDFTYRTETDATPHYYDASFQLDQLSSVDVVSSYWSGDTIAHIFLTFGFQDGRHIAMSIETRRQKRFAYSTIAGFFHHYELFYVVADERDLIGVRTDVRRERVYLYRLQLSPQSRDALFMSYVRQIQKLSAQPQWYNTLTDNCTTGILARAQAPGRARLNWRLVLSGYAPEYAYDHGLLNNSVSYATLKADSLIVRPEGAAITDHYSQDIRAGLALYPAPPSAGP
jgi:hypothetical protein